MTIREIADGFDNATRQGATADDPEGSRFVVFSDTSLRRIARDLRLEAGDRPDAECNSGAGSQDPR